ncbi:major Facilitator Superfamily protein [Asticcacaulis biprosthecium C19]|uniref:Major Facilitator Superfamily protein n=1 Tax=Asticcacaulis biprosthecium C19 TaxID=715226 RepID=F4QNM0_9CAUL|nr:MFS transporter [Asticcacaulis biprosthecium]EGF90928.1 major Facilitator Superfamily protein [Asticcacaulis biprosthecium C19]
MPNDLDRDQITSAAVQKASNYRWIICILLLVAMVINYTHRQTFALLKDVVGPEQGWTEQTYADIVFWFQCAYAIGYVSFGGIIDRIGARAGYGIAFVIWTVAHTLTGFVGNAFQFMIMRFALGIGESGSFPASLKAIAEWFPQKERALAVGIFNAGSNLGAIVAPFAVPLITLGTVHMTLGDFKLEMQGLGWGWQATFFVTGLGSMAWVLAWWALYRRPREHPKVNAAELAIIESDAADKSTKVPWLKIIGVKETWIFAIAKFLIDPIWWVWLFWLPGMLKKNYGLDLSSFGLPIIIIYLMSDVGSVAGGWMSSQLIKSGVSVNWSRKITLFVFALMVLPVFFLDGVKDLWTAVLIIGVATAAHQAFSANVYTIPTDTVPRAAVASVIGFGGMCGAIGGMLMSKNVGFILETTGSYRTIFWIAGSVYLIAVLVIHVMSPKLERTTKLDGVAETPKA